MIAESFDAFFTAAVSACGALIGLLFVAVSLAPHRLRHADTTVTAQTQATSALLSFTSALLVGLFALLPDTNIGWCATIAGALLLLYGAALLRVTFAPGHDQTTRESIRGISIGLIAIGTVQTWAGVVLLNSPHENSPVYTITGTTIASLLYGITRAWQLVGLSSTGFRRGFILLWKGQLSAEGVEIEGSTAPTGHGNPK